MKKITIIGVGLIGGSLGMALRSLGPKPYFKITGIGRNLQKLKLAKKLGAVDDYTLDWKEGLKDADIVVVCTPVDTIAGTVRKIIPYLKDKTIITDAGSVKGPVVRDVSKVITAAKKKTKKTVYFVGSHPMAGSERAGVQFADAKLYNRATVILSKPNPAPKAAVNEIIDMWEKTGAKVILINPFAHDKIVSLISHLPHLIAFSLCLLTRDLNRKDSRVSNFLAGSFRDLTRVANSSPGDWAAICKENRKELDKSITDFVKLLLNMKKDIKSKEKTEKLFLEAKIARQRLLNIF